MAQKWSNMALEWPKMIQNGPKITQNYPKWPKYDARIYALFPQFLLTEKAVPQTFSLLECMRISHFQSFHFKSKILSKTTLTDCTVAKSRSLGSDLLAPRPKCPPLFPGKIVCPSLLIQVCPSLPSFYSITGRESGDKSTWLIFHPQKNMLDIEVLGQSHSGTYWSFSVWCLVWVAETSQFNSQWVQAEISRLAVDADKLLHSYNELPWDILGLGELMRWVVRW